MSERDDPPEAETRKRKRSRRRSLRVPVDEVPRPTQAADAEVAAAGGRTVEMPVYDERATLEEPSEPRDATEAADAQPEALLGETREDDSDAPLEGEPTVVHPSSEAPSIGGAAEASASDAPSLEVVLDDEDEPQRDEPASAAPAGEEPSEEPAPEPPVTPNLGVIVQRVVAVVSAPGAAPPPEDDDVVASFDARPERELVDLIEDEEPELSLAEAAELEELDVDLEEGDAPSPPAVPAEAAGDAVAAEARDSAPELALEDAEALLEDDEGKRPSRPPPPPPSKAKDAPADPAPAEAAPPTAKRKKPRRSWWEDLFNDDYLRTVPIPHPRVIARQCDFIAERFGLAPGATILDVGCGLGLHAVELTRRGYLVVGLDLSLPMLARAADEAQDNGFKINFLHADMREMTFDGAFDAVLCYGTTFGYFDDETNKQIIERLYRALKPRGLLLLDVVNRDFVIRNQPNLVWFEGDGCVVMEESQMNYITSRLAVKRTVILDNGRQRDNVYSLRTYALHELGQILHHQGFRVVEVTGWEAHPGVFFGVDSPKLIILAERRPQGPPVPPGRTASGEMPAVDGDADAGEEDAADEPPAAADAEPAEPSPAVSEALADALEQSGELSPAEPDELDPEELAEDDLEED